MCYDDIYTYTYMYYIPQELQIKGGKFNISICHMERGGPLRDARKSIHGGTGGQIPPSVLHIMRIHTWFASHERDATL